MCGIFAYLNHLEAKTRKEILRILIKGLQRLEYRGYDSAGTLFLFISRYKRTFETPAWSWEFKSNCA